MGRGSLGLQNFELQPIKAVRLLAAVSAVLVLGSCGRASEVTPPVASDDPGASSTLSPSPSPLRTAPASCDPLEGGEEGVHMLLVDVRTAKHEGYDRFVFEFRPGESSPDAIPRYRLTTVTPPFSKSPSDEPMEVDGSRFFAINLQGATGVDMSGPTYKETYTGPEEIKPGTPVLVEAEQQGDFEATLDWIFGVQGGGCPTVTKLTKPTRLAIDFHT